MAGEIMPSQFVDMFRVRANGPETKLILAVLEDAFRCAQGEFSNYRPRHSDQIREARAWIASESCGLMSFNWCCDALGLEPSGLRIRVLSGTVALPRRSPSSRGRICQFGAPRAYGKA
jgi:hypothetical protein